jgi:nucleoside diphosphate kinase
MKITVALFVLLIGLVSITANAQNDKDKIYIPTELDKQAEFKGGIDDFYKFVRENFGSPLVKEDITFKVFAKFVVERDGSLSNIEVQKDPGNGIGHEVVRVLMKSPKWKPGKVDGKVVRSTFTVPISLMIKGSDAIENLEELMGKGGIAPSFPGGIQAFYQKFADNFKMPANVQRKQVSELKVSFVVEVDGSMSSFKVIEDNGLGQDAIEALKKIKEKWNPGFQDGKYVRASYNLPIRLNIE